ncbi:MAG: hypothetical protein JSV81_14685 [Anaerolineales bacterium]|nr:MAG: hypothetical protein JSV81_14685 [Anaerolineales bacterium]
MVYSRSFSPFRYSATWAYTDIPQTRICGIGLLSRAHGCFAGHAYCYRQPDADIYLIADSHTNAHAQPHVYANSDRHADAQPIADPDANGD